MLALHTSFACQRAFIILIRFLGFVVFGRSNEQFLLIVIPKNIFFSLKANKKKYFYIELRLIYAFYTALLD